MIVLGSGGHTGEMLSWLRALNKEAPHSRLNTVYIVANTDAHSAEKAKSFERSVAGREAIILHVPRAREVGQSYFTSIFTTLKASFSSMLAVWTIDPDVILTNGPGTCLPVIASAWVLSLPLRRILPPRSPNIVIAKPRCVVAYLESFACVSHLSLTGRLIRLLRAADIFTVAWPPLLLKTPGASYAGRVPVDMFDATGAVKKPFVRPVVAPGPAAAAAPAAHGTAIVTVGSTVFPALLEGVNTRDVASALVAHGVRSVTVQAGKTPFRPTGLASRDSLRVSVVTYTDALPTLIRRADVVITHGGAGTILEALSAQRRVVVVPNRALMNDHQQELVDTLAKLGHVVAATPETVAGAIYTAYGGDAMTFRPTDRGDILHSRLRVLIGDRFVAVPQRDPPLVPGPYTLEEDVDGPVVTDSATTIAAAHGGVPAATVGGV